MSAREHFAILISMTAIKNTKARRIVEQLITDADTPITAAEIVQKVNALDSAINRATVFRILSRLTDRGLIESVRFADGKTRYEHAGDHHHHLVCTECGSIQGVHVCDAEFIARRSAREVGFEIRSHKLEYFGLCKKCHDKNILPTQS